MRYGLALLSVLAIAVAGQAPSRLTIANVTIVDGTDRLPRVGSVTIEGDRIAAVTYGGTGTPAPGDAMRIDGTGRFLIPGLWDMHVHLAMRPEPGLAEQVILPLLLAHGVVGVRDMGGPLDRVLDLRARVADGRQTGPRILTPGPFVDGPGDPDRFFLRPGSAAAAAATVEDLVARGADFVKVQAGVEPAVHGALVRAARAAKVPLAGHVPLSMTAEAVIASGQRSLEHISPALVGDGLLLLSCSSRAEELVRELRSIERDRAAAPRDEIAAREHALRARAVATYDPARAQAIGRSMAERDVWIVPTLVWSAAFRPLSATDDGASQPADLAPAALQARWRKRRLDAIQAHTPEMLAANAAVAAAAGRAIADLGRGGARVLAGTDTFDAFVLPGRSLHDELALLVAGGLSPLQALQAATREPAAYRGAAGAEGTIQQGYRADLVLLDANPLDDIRHVGRIRAVVAGGVLHDRDALDRLLDEVRAFAAR